jgi:hypothetical protein
VTRTRPPLQIAVLAALALVCAGAAAPACADDRVQITKLEQDLADALVPGDVKVWDRTLDSGVIVAEEDGSFKGKSEMLKEIEPMPKGLGGNIVIELLAYHEEGRGDDSTAVALFREHETEQYYGQIIHASYLSNTTWKKRPDGWKLLAVQLIAERTQPPSVALPAETLQQYAGIYKLRNSEPTLTLTVVDGRLMGARTGRKAAEWLAETPDVFFIPGDLRIRKIFQRDAAGKVTRLTERRESWDIVWDKIG